MGILNSSNQRRRFLKYLVVALVVALAVLTAVSLLATTGAGMAAQSITAVLQSDPELRRVGLLAGGFLLLTAVFGFLSVRVLCR